MPMSSPARSARIDEMVELDKVIGQVEPGDRFPAVQRRAEQNPVRQRNPQPARRAGRRPATELLIAAALAHRVNDNVTAVVVEV